MEHKRIGFTILLDEPFEWSNDSSLEVFMNALEEGEEDDTTRSTRKVVNRNRVKAAERLHRDYFCDDPKFGEAFFQDRYRMPKHLFLKITHDVESRYEYFQESYDGRAKKSFTPKQKCTSAIKQLATGNPPDEFDEYLEMSQRTSRDCLQYFCAAIVELYGRDFLRRPTSHDVARLYEAHEERHHIPGSNNDVNVVMQSLLFLTERNGTAPKCPFHVNGRTYKRGYYLTDGMYPTWSTFVKAFKYPTNPKEKKFKKVQESARKDVERAFGVLKGKWGILNRPLRPHTLDRIRNLVYACVILHNMIIRDAGTAISPVHIRDPPIQLMFDKTALNEIRHEDTHFRLRYDLMEHINAQHLPYIEVDDEEDEI